MQVFALLKEFGSVEGIKNASVEAIAGVKGFSLKSAEARPDVAPVQLEGRELINLPKEVTQPARPIEEVSESEPSAQYAYRPGVFRRATDSYNAVAKNTSFGPPLLP